MESSNNLRRLLIAVCSAFFWAILFSMTFFQSEIQAAVFFSEDFSSGTFGSVAPMFVPGDPCDATDDVSVDQTDHRPGASDNFAYHVSPPPGDIAACCHGPEAFTIGQDQEFYFTFWQKFGDNCLWESGAGKGPEVRGRGNNRIVVGPAWFEESWSVPNPPTCSRISRCATIPCIMNFTALYAQGESWRPYNSCDGLCWTQNIDVGNPVYIERGYWYRFKLYVYVHTNSGRMRLWVKREDWSAEKEIIDTDRECGSVVTLSSQSTAYSAAHPHYNYDDHGGGGANSGFQLWLDDILVTDYDPYPQYQDTTDPTIAMTSPTSGSAYSTEEDTITIGGTASDNVGVTGVTWQNDRGGNGTASGTTSWTISNISLQEGDNVITVTAHDAALNTGTDTLTVTCTYTPPYGTYTKEFGSGTGTDYPGTVEDTFINVNDENSSTYEYLNTYTWPQDKVANAIIMNWNLSTIPSSATIQSATLYLYLSDIQDGGGDDLYDLTVHKIIHYNPVISTCTGYTYNGTNSWTPNSECYNNIPLAQADIAAAKDTKSIDKTYGYKSWNVTNMVQDWVSNQVSNYGMLVNSDTVASSGSNRFFSATESSNPDQRPKLVVTYSVGEDVTPPTVSIAQPTSTDTYITEQSTITLSGAASDNVGVTSVTWTNSRGGNGTASGTTDWTISAIPLYCGDNNVITITAKDAANNAASATLTIDVSPCPPSGL